MLNVLNLESAQNLLLNQCGPDRRLPAEQVLLSQLTGRVLAEPILVMRDVPAFDRAQVDGLAVRSTDTFGASDSLPAILQLVGEVEIGQDTTLEIRDGQCAYVPTGGMLPAGADAMVMIEYVEALDATTRLVSQRVSPGQSVTRRGDDARAGQQLLAADHCIQATDIGALAALGLSEASVRRAVRVGVLSTGDELRDVRAMEQLAVGQILDVNRPMLVAALTRTGICVTDYGIVPDQLEQLNQTLQQAVTENELVLISGGSSVGARDFVEQAINQAGEPGVLFHGIAVKPGKPTLAGRCHDTLVIGLPGHPVAAWFMFEQLALPLVAAWQGQPAQQAPRVIAQLASRLPSNHGREEFVLVRLERAGSTVTIEQTAATLAGSDEATGIAPAWLARPLATRSGLITQLTAGDGYLRIPRDCEGLEAGEVVTVYCFSVK